MTIDFSGQGLSGGYCRVRVGLEKRFSLCVHDNSLASFFIPLNIKNLFIKNHLVHLRNPKTVKVVEHLFSALYGLGLFNVKIELFGDEIPFFDGSSKFFIAQLLSLKKNTLRHLQQVDFLSAKEIYIKRGESFIHYKPTDRPELEIDMELCHPYIKKQRVCLRVDEKVYINEIAPARTFVFTTEKDPRLKNLPPYGIGITPDNIYSQQPLRFSDEPVRHKILDFLGDLYVLQKNLTGKITATNTSHLLNLGFVKKLMGCARNNLGH